MLFSRRNATTVVISSLLIISNASQSHASSIFQLTDRAIGDACSTTGLVQRSCAEGLTCMPSPLPAGGSECLPVDCLAHAANEFSSQVNITEYQVSIFDQAGVTTEQFFLQGDFGKAYMANWTDDSILSNLTDLPGLTGLRNNIGRSEPCNIQTARAMLTSPYVKAVMDAIINNPIPQEPFQNYEAAIAQCDPEGKLSERTISGVLGTVGFGAGAGVGLGAYIEFFFSFPGGTPFFFIDLGGGIFVGADIGVSVSIGMVFTGDPAQIPGVGFELELVVPIPFVGPGVSVGLDIEGIWDLSFFINGGIGLSIGALNAGYTWGF